VVTIKVAEVAPAGTVTKPGTVALVELDDIKTAVPPAGAAPFSVTVPVLELPPGTLDGAHVNVATSGGFTVSLAVTVTNPTVADKFAVVGFVTGTVLI
jgi:hypothetical protein